MGPDKRGGSQPRINAGVLYVSIRYLGGSREAGMSQLDEMDWECGEGEDEELKQGMGRAKCALEHIREEWGWYKELGKPTTIGIWRLGSLAPKLL